MSRNTGKSTQRIDRRIQRTRDRLGDAFMELLLEKPFENITVQEVLDRAKVSRSTFYVHYRNKEDLFFSDVDEFLEGIATMLSRREESSNRIAPVRELFTHIVGTCRFYRALVTSGRMHNILQLGEGHFGSAIEKRLAGLSDARGMSTERRAAVAHALAGSLLSLLSWWIKHGMRESPARMDDLFHSMVWKGVNSPAAEMAPSPAMTN
jgi:AcrR family transcriptional regulator